MDSGNIQSGIGDICRAQPLSIHRAVHRPGIDDRDVEPVRANRGRGGLPGGSRMLRLPAEGVRRRVRGEGRRTGAHGHVRRQLDELWTPRVDVPARLQLPGGQPADGAGDHHFGAQHTHPRSVQGRGRDSQVSHLGLRGRAQERDADGGDAQNHHPAPAPPDAHHPAGGAGLLPERRADRPRGAPDQHASAGAGSHTGIERNRQGTRTAGFLRTTDRRAAAARLGAARPGRERGRDGVVNREVPQLKGAFTMKRARTLLAAVGIAVLLAGTAHAMNFSERNFKQLVDVDSKAAIAPGTTITAGNWEQYRQFMPVWMQAAFSGEYHAHVGSGAQFAMVVEPTVHYPMPLKFVEDTEKYGGQTKLVARPDGGFTWQGYVAGLPFPNPTEPNLGVKILYNTWAKFLPWAVHFWSDGALVDRFGNRSFQRVEAGWYRTSHISYPGIAPDFSFAKGVLYTTRFIVDSPEQSKYTTEMTLQTDDPTRLQEVYVFLPSLRRSLRLSSAAHCAPVLGTDYVQDDNSWLPSNYHVDFLGEKKLLQIVPDIGRASCRE